MIKFCRSSAYPEQLVLRLSDVNRIRQVQLLAHEYKVYISTGVTISDRTSLPTAVFPQL